MRLGQLDTEDTIVAVSTPPGAGALRTIIRLSGPGCMDLAGRVFQGDRLQPAEAGGFRTVQGLVSIGPGLHLPATGYVFRSPRSYTGQDVFELHLPGSGPLAEQVVELLLSAGGRAAEPGEFTLRAVLSGRLDLTGAEAVAALIAARGDGQLRAAMQLADGLLVRSVAAAVNRLADLLAEVEAGLDFADEPIQFISVGQLAEGLDEVRQALVELRADAGSFETLQRQPTVALVGRPNAGKSTLLNRLTGLERALCSPLAGTTRDVLTAPLSLPDGEVMLLDGAGLRTGPGDEIERQAQAAVRRAARAADMLLVVLDAACPMAEQLAMLDWPELKGRPAVIVLNKVDLLSGAAPARGDDLAEAVSISALTGQGLDRLRAVLNERVFPSAAAPAEGLMLNARHRAALAEAERALGRARELLSAGGDQDYGQVADLLAQELREAVEQLGRISGQVMTEDILDRIFSRFCIGK